MSRAPQIPKIVVIGGGTGTFLVLNALKKHPVRLAAIVSMADDGGSTGILRDQYGVLPPGDIRRALVALSQESTSLRKLFNYRFKNGDIGGHSFGNLFLSALEKIEGSFERAVDEAARILNIAGEVIPVTLDNVRLNARLADGVVIRGETNIDIPRERTRAPIAHVWLSPAGSLNPRAKAAILSADMVVIGPGDLYTSIIPNILVSGMPDTLKKTRAKKVYVANLMTKHGETDNFSGTRFVEEIEKYLGPRIIDYAIFNDKKPAHSVLLRYEKEGATFVDPKNADSALSGTICIFTDLLARGPFIRHDHKKLSAALLSISKK